MEFLWQNFVSVDFSVTSGVKYGTIHISVGLFDLCAEFDFKRRFLHAKTLICDISCADSGDRNFRRNGVWRGKNYPGRYNHIGGTDGR